MSELTKQGKLLRTTAGLEPYTGEWDYKHAAHLLRRTMFGPKESEINLCVRNGLSWTLNMLLDSSLAPPEPPGEWAVNNSYQRPLATGQSKDERIWRDETRAWWLQLMAEQNISIIEKLTLFWHDHFATQAKDVKIPQWMYRQNQTLRKYALGNFRDLLNAITLDPAMLYYLDGRLNKKGKPNENWAREVMELFTLGEGNYTERDIGEAARAYTGWVVKNDEPVFVQSRHDTGFKEILGKGGIWDHTDATNIILSYTAPSEQSVPLVAQFICRKLYRYFVYEVPDENIVNGMAETFHQSNLEIKPVLLQLLSSAHFFDESTFGSIIKGPLDLVVGTVRQLEISDVNVDFAYLVGGEMGQILLDPPDVSGWPGYRRWISTATLPLRHNFTNNLVDGFIKNSNNKKRNHTVDVINKIAIPLSGTANPYLLILSLAKLLLPFPLTAELETLLFNTLLDGAEENDWSVFYEGADIRIRNVIKAFLALPEYQLS